LQLSCPFFVPLPMFLLSSFYALLPSPCFSTTLCLSRILHYVFSMFFVVSVFAAAYLCFLVVTSFATLAILAVLLSGSGSHTFLISVYKSFLLLNILVTVSFMYHT
jgi:hypothetical protein